MHKYAPIVFLVVYQELQGLQHFQYDVARGLVNPKGLQSFMVWNCSVCELRESNSKEKMKNFGT